MYHKVGLQVGEGKLGILRNPHLSLKPQAEAEAVKETTDLLSSEGPSRNSSRKTDWVRVPTGVGHAGQLAGVP